MTSATTRMPNAAERVAAVAIMAAALTALAIAPASAKAAKPKVKAQSAQDAATIQDVSGLSVTRTWKIVKNDPNTLVTTITVQNTTPAPIATSIVEPIPTASLERITFTPLKMHTSSIPGLGRYDITVPAGGNLSFGYTAHLTKDRKAAPQDRLITVKGEMDATLPVAQATEADHAIALVKAHYFGPLEVTEAFEEGIDGPGPTLGPVGTASLSLTPTPSCRVVARSCHFTAQDNATREPKLAALDATGNALVANGAADVANSGLTCDSVEATAVTVKNWAFEPTGWRLTWAGWEVTKGRYTIVTDVSVPESGRCVRASAHTVTTGLLTG